MHYHAHVYFDLQQLHQATQLHRALSHLPVALGRIHTQAIGPHPKAMFQAVFTAADYPRLRNWLDAHRNDLDVLIHKETGDNWKDHTIHAEWLGNPQALNLEIFEGENAGGFT